jgi:hypothetical protein
MAQVETEDFETVSPFAEIGFLRVALSGVAREAGSDDELGAGAQKFQTGLIADFDAAARDERDTAGEVSEFGALAEIKLGALGAQLVVKVVNDGILALADIAVL